MIMMNGVPKHLLRFTWVQFVRVRPKNLVLGQNGDYGEGNNVSRSFALFKSVVDGKSSLENNLSLEGSRIDVMFSSLLSSFIFLT